MKLGTRFKFLPLTPQRWRDLEKLFGARGACGGCWCMWYRLSRKEWLTGKGAKNKAAFKAIVEAGTPPGILAYAGTEPIGWCAVAPRAEYPRLAGSRVLAPVDAQPVWSISCLFVAKEHRRAGVSTALIEAAAEFVAKRGGKLVEGYPVEPGKKAVPDAFVWTGLVSAFHTAGFKEVARRSASRPIMRRTAPPKKR